MDTFLVKLGDILKKWNVRKPWGTLEEIEKIKKKFEKVFWRNTYEKVFKEIRSKFWVTSSKFEENGGNMEKIRRMWKIL